MTLTKEEYIALIAKLVDQQYGKEIEQEDEDRGQVSGSPEVPNRPNPNTIIDVTTYKRNDIEPALLKSANLKVDSFIIKIHHYTTTNDGYECYSLRLYEESPHVYLNRPCTKTTKIKPDQDNRFDSRTWANYFNGRDFATAMPHLELLDMIRWLQAIGKMGAFL